MRELHEIGISLGTDKADAEHRFNGKSYLDIYEQYFSLIKDKKVNFLEIGVKTGRSLHVWKKYFAEANIVGLDIDPSAAKCAHENIKIVIGDQCSCHSVDAVKKITNNESFDVILDDGSHLNPLTIGSFNLFFPLLKSGGIYIIEDLSCSYLGDKLSEHVKSWPGMEYNTVKVESNNRSDLDTFFMSLVRGMDLNIFGPVDFVHFYSKLAIIKKA